MPDGAGRYGRGVAARRAGRLDRSGRTADVREARARCDRTALPRRGGGRRRVIGTAGGITSLVAYPALLAVGIPPLAANVTNSVALIGSGLSSALRAGPDLVGHARTIRAWLPASVLFSSPAGPRCSSSPPVRSSTGSCRSWSPPGPPCCCCNRRSPVADRSRTVAVPSGRGAAGAGVAVYNGYFGAGSGILLIALLLLTTEPVLHRANALKNVVLVAADCCRPCCSR